MDEITEAQLAEWERLTKEATPGPWMAEKSMRDECSVHYAIRTVDCLPAHPHSPRFVAWMTGLLRDYLAPPQRQRFRFCEACQHGYWDGRSVPVEVRDDPQVAADAALFVAARDALPLLLAEVRRLRAPSPSDRSGEGRTEAVRDRVEALLDDYREACVVFATRRPGDEHAQEKADRELRARRTLLSALAPAPLREPEAPEEAECTCIAPNPACPNCNGTGKVTL